MAGAATLVQDIEALVEKHSDVALPADLLSRLAEEARLMAVREQVRHDTLDSGALGLEHSRGSTWALRRIHALYGSQLTVKSLKLFQSVAAVYAAILVSDEYPRSKTGRHAMVTKKYVDIGVPVAFAWLKASGVPLPPELTEDRMMCTTFGPKCKKFGDVNDAASRIFYKHRATIQKWYLPWYASNMSDAKLLSSEHEGQLWEQFCREMFRLEEEERINASAAKRRANAAAKKSGVKAPTVEGGNDNAQKETEVDVVGTDVNPNGYADAGSGPVDITGGDGGSGAGGGSHGSTAEVRGSRDEDSDGREEEKGHSGDQEGGAEFGDPDVTEVPGEMPENYVPAALLVFIIWGPYSEQPAAEFCPADFNVLAPPVKSRPTGALLYDDEVKEKEQEEDALRGMEAVSNGSGSAAAAGRRPREARMNGGGGGGGGGSTTERITIVEESESARQHAMEMLSLAKENVILKRRFLDIASASAAHVSSVADSMQKMANIAEQRLAVAQKRQKAADRRTVLVNMKEEIAAMVECGMPTEEIDALRGEYMALLRSA